ncbi:MAG: hypothetical protein GTO45_16310 [Candidatus Aminicenantes bacterium]|nr:hypothetical protein [Candidatus Aminicenantes bacterium]NIM78265.1 hypothetical protein [Candidatus Aminicenantes bacterium]NIN19690.1 hypothetical protein [Candidatus Aminicenantes bacterium]NIN43572.1 hypothetical protein [Candidatus Aminicenantes bacterium]NIN86317.1 hypothetical protein [Candidatus Aminicenantes bacterium]
MVYLRTSIPTFLADSRALIYGVKADSFIKGRILPYNVDETRITEYVAIYDAAELAESKKSKEFGEQLEASIIFERIFKEAEALFRKHRDFLKLLLKDDIDKQKKLFLVGVPRAKKIADLLKHMREVYFRTLEHDEVVTGVARYGITREDLETGLQKVIEAMDAKEKHNREKGDAEDATLLRDDAFEKLDDVVDELETILYYALEDRPQLLEKLGIPVLSPGYKRRTKSQEEQNPEPETPGEGT